MKKIIAIIFVFLVWISLDLEVFYINSNSMNPYLYVGDVVVTKPFSEYKDQDVVTFRINPKTYVTHRLIRTHDEMFQTKGDANNTPDSKLLEEKNIVGKILLVIPTHKIINFLYGAKGGEKI